MDLDPFARRRQARGVGDLGDEPDGPPGLDDRRDLADHPGARGLRRAGRCETHLQARPQALAVRGGSVPLDLQRPARGDAGEHGAGRDLRLRRDAPVDDQQAADRRAQSEPGEPVLGRGQAAARQLGSAL